MLTIKTRKEPQQTRYRLITTILRCLRNGRQFMCTHETNHPSSGQLLLSTRAITHLQLNNVSREYFAYVMTRIPDFLPFPNSFWHGRGVQLLINQVSRHETQPNKGDRQVGYSPQVATTQHLDAWEMEGVSVAWEIEGSCVCTHKRANFSKRTSHLHLCTHKFAFEHKLHYLCTFITTWVPWFSSVC